MYVDFNGSARGPMWGPNFMEVGIADNGIEHTLQIYPDISNDDLRNAGKPMYFYIMPNSVRMAKNDEGKFMFHFTKFAGVLTEDSNIGVNGQEEVAGGVLSFTSTLELPDGVVESIKEQIKAKIKNDNKFRMHPLWMFADNTPPRFELGWVPVEENEVAISNLTMADIGDETVQAADDKWLWRMQGEGKGSLDPNGKNACTAMVGQYPAALIQAGFKGETAPMFVHNALKLRFYTPSIKITTHADYSKIFDGFTSNTKYKDNWTQENIHRAFQDETMQGFIKTKIIFGEAELTEEQKETYYDIAEKAKQRIMENVKKFIFERKPPTLTQAEAAATRSRQQHTRSYFWGLIKYNYTTESDNGYSYALNTNFDRASIQMDDELEIQGPYFKTTVVSGNMQGFFDEIKADPEAAKQYFSFVNMGDAFKKIHVIATARANWPDALGNGDPIDKLTISVGYKDQNGIVQYKNSGRYYDNLSKKLSEDFSPAIWSTVNKDRVFVFDFAVDDNLPAEDRNKVFVKRTVTYKLDPRVKINEDNQVVVPDEETTDTQLEVQADVTGHLNVGPIYLNADLNKHMMVEVTFMKEGFDSHSVLFTLDNINEKQRFELWTDEADEAIKWKYKVSVTYKSFGPLQAITYEGEEVEMEGSFPRGKIITLPAPPADLIERLKEYKAQAKELELLDV